MRTLYMSASLAAIMLSIPAASFAQDDVERIKESTKEKEARQETVVVTGSAIKGTPEDAALPVNVYSAQDLELQGSPTGLEFAKELPQSGPTNGESNFFAGGPLIGSVNINLRSLGSDKTLTLMNGRRMSENTSNIPSIAIGRTEILKDGAAVIYGADAVGGVVNFITKEGFTGFEAKADYKYIADTDGEWSVGALAGFGEGDVNLMVAAEWEHRSRLDTLDRDFSSMSYWDNPSAWSSLTNAANYTPGRLSATTGFGTFLTSPLTGYYTDFTQTSCESQGGVWQPTEALGPRCAYGYAPFYNLIEDQDIYRIFGQIDARVNANMDFHMDVAYSSLKVPEQYSSPSFPTTRGPAPTTGATFQYWVPKTNPYVAEWEARSGASAFPLGFLTQGYIVSLLRPFAHNGNPALGGADGYGTPNSVDRDTWRVSASLDGTLGDLFGPLKEVGYDVAVTYNSTRGESKFPDYLGFRLQEALNGFGGPNCNAADLDPNVVGTQNAAAAGQNGCEYFNPFSSAYAGNPETGAVNPLYVPGYENSKELMAWLFDERLNEETVESVTFDAVFNGMTGINLAGGEIGWALGSQVRHIESREYIPSEYYNGATPCPYPGESVCPGEYGQGPFGFLGLDEANYYDQDGYSLFGEAHIPVLDNLNFQAAVRREEFSGGLGATVYKVSGKWDVAGPLSLRGSYGTNFTAPDISLQPGTIERVVRGYTRASSAWLSGSTLTRSDIKPEEATTWNLGAIWNSEGFAPSHALTATIDYFNIETKGEIGELASHDQIANAVFDATSKLADCSSPFIGRITFNDDPVNSPGGTCIQGLTSMTQFNDARTDRGNGADQQTAGIDFDINYLMDLSGADLTFGLTGTRLTKLQSSASYLDGVEVAGADDRLGFLNFSSVGFMAPKWRVNGFINYNRDKHNVRLSGRYVSGVVDERGVIVANGVLPGTNTPNTASTKGGKVDSNLVFDATWVYDLNDSVRLTGTVANILDEDPPFVRNEFGYDPRSGTAFGRTFKVGVKYSH